MSRTASLAVLVAGLSVCVVAAVVLAALGVPATGAAVASAMVGSALVVTHMARSRRDRAAVCASPHALAQPVQVAAERVAVGSPWKLRWRRSDRDEWAPGLLCMGPGVLCFVPSRESHADRAVERRVARVQLAGVKGTKASVIRADGGAEGDVGTVQFVVQVPDRDLRPALESCFVLERLDDPPPG